MSSNEAAYCGTPMLLIPLYGDHLLNANAAVSRGMGAIVNYDYLTAESMKRAIAKVSSISAQENAKAVSNLFANRSQSAAEAAVWWTEYVAKTKGAPLLSSYTKQMSYFAFHQFDVYILVLMTIPDLKSAFARIFSPLLVLIEEEDAQQPAE